MAHRRKVDDWIMHLGYQLVMSSTELHRHLYGVRRLNLNSYSGSFTPKFEKVRLLGKPDLIQWLLLGEHVLPYDDAQGILFKCVPALPLPTHSTVKAHLLRQFIGPRDGVLRSSRSLCKLSEFAVLKFGFASSYQQFPLPCFSFNS